MLRLSSLFIASLLACSTATATSIAIVANENQVVLSPGTTALLTLGATNVADTPSALLASAVLRLTVQPDGMSSDAANLALEVNSLPTGLFGSTPPLVNAVGPTTTINLAAAPPSTPLLPPQSTADLISLTLRAAQGASGRYLVTLDPFDGNDISSSGLLVLGPTGPQRVAFANASPTPGVLLSVIVVPEPTCLAVATASILAVGARRPTRPTVAMRD